MSEKMREEFHKWCDSQGFASDRYEMCDLGEKYKHLCGEYVIPDSRILWMAWQASRAALVVELPELKSFNASDEPDFAYEVAIDDIKCALDDAGVVYK